MTVPLLIPYQRSLVHSCIRIEVLVISLALIDEWIKDEWMNDTTVKDKRRRMKDE